MHSAPKWQEADGVDARRPCPHLGLTQPLSREPHVAPGLLLGRADTWLVWVWLYRLVKHALSSRACVEMRLLPCARPAMPCSPLAPLSPSQSGTAGNQRRLIPVLGLISRMLEASVSSRGKALGSVGLSLLYSACPRALALLATSGEKAPVGFQIPSSHRGPGGWEIGNIFGFWQHLGLAPVNSVLSSGNIVTFSLH